MREKDLWGTYNKIVINNERAFELMRVVQALLPDKKKSPDEYNFHGILGVVQDILENNDGELTRHEDEIMELERSLPGENNEL